MSSATWLNPAGGLRYHLRARRYSEHLWQPFRWALGDWLLRWEPPEKTLLIAGPSGGYNLQPFLLERFDRVVCLEPDPLARWIFRRRLAAAPLDKRPELTFIAEDHLVEHPERLEPLLDQLGDVALLFSNVLGQLGALLGTTDPENPKLVRVREAVAAARARRSWVSFHDRVSGSMRPAFEGMLVADHRLKDNEVISQAFPVDEGVSPNRDTELLDHLTADFFPSELEHVYFSWELMPGIFHLIEGVAEVRPRARMNGD